MGGGSGRGVSPACKPSPVSASPPSLKHPVKMQDAGVHAAGREKEIRRQAVLLKHQMERHRLDMVWEPIENTDLYQDMTFSRMILTDMHTRLSEVLRKRKTEENTCDWSKLPTFSSIRTPKREHSCNNQGPWLLVCVIYQLI
ncbi:Bromodomain adjacent to zinc finger domain protein 2B [Manis javanica]|nr:Bromodomain adjacent to zinc finger domain protein 2B [Manis javanica]